MADSPTTRVRRAANLEGWIWGNVETRQGPISRDLFGVFDAVLLATHECDLAPGAPTLIAVQVTSASNRSSRLRRLRESKTLPVWLADGTRGAALTTTGTKRGVDLIRWTTLTLDEDGGLVEEDRWIEG